mmetsp:Transcript_16703/g.57575  ORF Transcript_16703/g.57575 Transcript_16703/m.57575 type:complete len:468 (+) Transcript_16703:3117-4520(+)
MLPERRAPRPRQLRAVVGRRGREERVPRGRRALRLELRLLVAPADGVGGAGVRQRLRGGAARLGDAAALLLLPRGLLGLLRGRVEVVHALRLRAELGLDAVDAVGVAVFERLLELALELVGAVLHGLALRFRFREVGLLPLRGVRGAARELLELRGGDARGAPGRQRPLQPVQALRRLGQLAPPRLGRVADERDERRGRGHERRAARRARERRVLARGGLVEVDGGVGGGEAQHFPQLDLLAVRLRVLVVLVLLDVDLVLRGEPARKGRARDGQVGVARPGRDADDAGRGPEAARLPQHDAREAVVRVRARARGRGRVRDRRAQNDAQALAHALGPRQQRQGADGRLGPARALDRLLEEPLGLGLVERRDGRARLAADARVVAAARPRRLQRRLLRLGGGVGDLAGDLVEELVAAAAEARGAVLRGELVHLRIADLGVEEEGRLAAVHGRPQRAPGGLVVAELVVAH